MADGPRLGQGPVQLRPEGQPGPANDLSMAIRQSAFSWPVVEPRFLAIGSRVGNGVLRERRVCDESVWFDNKNWKLGLYFGRGDRRLWVPKRDELGCPHSTARVVNFSHSMGRKAFRVLAIAYGICIVGVGLVVCALVGHRW